MYVQTLQDAARKQANMMAQEAAAETAAATQPLDKPRSKVELEGALAGKLQAASDDVAAAATSDAVKGALQTKETWPQDEGKQQEELKKAAQSTAANIEVSLAETCCCRTVMI